MTFSTYEQYLADREDLCNRMEDAASADDSALFDQLDADVKALDNGWEEYKVKMANVAAIKKEAKPMANIIEPTATTVVEDLLDSVEYRKAFMNYVQTGDMSGFSNDVTKTSDASVMIPTTVLNRIIEKIEATGMILNEVTRTAYKGGVTVPTSAVKPVASWVSEGAGSTAQKKSVAGTLTFAYHKLRCAVAVTLEMDVMALEVFERTLIANVAEAMVKALEDAIINGDGSGKPKGILAETAPTGQNIEIGASANPTYATIVGAEAALPLAYENGAKWFMTKKTFMAIEGMVDGNGQPIARVNIGLDGKPERVLLGRPVVLNDYMVSLGASISEDTVVAFLFNPKDYILNTNLAMTMKTYEDNATDDKVTKAIMLVDGKVVDVRSLVTVTKKAS